MSYTKQTWQCGETITADKLNHMEDGIEECCSNSGGALIVEFDHHEDCPVGYMGDGIDYYNHTWQEVKDAYDEGRPIYMQYVATDADPGTTICIRETLVMIGENESYYSVGFVRFNGNLTGLIADSADGVLKQTNCVEGGDES